MKKGASHGIGHMLGGVADVPHGYTSCVMLPSVLAWNEGVNDEQQAVVSETLGRPGEIGELISGLGMPTRLRDVGVKQDQFQEIAAASMHDRWIPSNPRKITDPAQVVEILVRWLGNRRMNRQQRRRAARANKQNDGHRRIAEAQAVYDKLLNENLQNADVHCTTGTTGLSTRANGGSDDVKRALRPNAPIW